MPTEPVDQEPRLFAVLQRADQRPVAGDGDGGDVAVQLCLDGDGAYLQIVDGKGRPRDVDHRVTRGPFSSAAEAAISSVPSAA